MRKFYTLLMAMIMSGVAWSQNRNVTFQVDMTGQTIDATGVHIAGDFQGPAGGSNWTPNGTTMNQVGMTDIYAVTVSIPDGIYNFKFINGDAWGKDESVPDICTPDLGNRTTPSGNDRYVNITSDTTLPAIMYGGTAPMNKHLVNLVVDMNEEATVEDTISVAGNFQGWSPGTSIMYSHANDSIYRYITYVDPMDTLDFKFINGNAWGQDEANIPSICNVGGNRRLIVSSDTVYGEVKFDSCFVTPAVTRYNVTVNVDMGANCDFDPANDSVDISGPFRGWAGDFDSAWELTDPDGDLVYSGTFAMVSPLVEYKARFHGAGGTSWEPGGNNVVNFTADTILNDRCFGFVSGACPNRPNPSDITFQVNILNAPPHTKVFLIGDFTSPQWQSGAIELTPSTTVGVMETTVSAICPPKIAYKFMLEDGNGNQIEEDFSAATDTTCLEPSGTGNFNRFYVRPDDQPKTLLVDWESCSSSIGLEEEEAQAFKIFPNPSQGQTTIELGLGKYDVRIYNMTGAQVAAFADAEGRVEWNATDLQAGVYLVQVSNKDGFNRSEKVVLQ